MAVAPFGHYIACEGARAIRDAGARLAPAGISWVVLCGIRIADAHHAHDGDALGNIRPEGRSWDDRGLPVMLAGGPPEVYATHATLTCHTHRYASFRGRLPDRLTETYALGVRVSRRIFRLPLFLPGFLPRPGGGSREATRSRRGSPEAASRRRLPGARRGAGRGPRRSSSA